MVAVEAPGALEWLAGKREYGLSYIIIPIMRHARDAMRAAWGAFALALLLLCFSLSPSTSLLP